MLLEFNSTLYETILSQLFDNMDGKQARRTGTSSPLGMLFDHGCDAFNSFMQALTISRVVMLDSLLNSFAIVFMVALFYLATYEQYIFSS